MKVTIVKISRQTTNKDGQPLIGKNGRPYTRLGIQTDKHGSRWLSGFGSPDNADWQVGSQVEIEEKQSDKTDKNGIHYLNFETPRKTMPLEAEFHKLSERVSALEKKIDSLLVQADVKDDQAELDSIADSIPF